MSLGEGAALRCWWVAALLLVLPATAVASQELHLPDLLRSTLEAHPKIAVIEAKIDEADASIIAARGQFDLKAYAEGGYSPLGKYDEAYGEFGLKQPTTLRGAEFFAKYQNGADFAPYDGAQVTSTAGKVSLGVLLPLVRGGAIDEPRFERRRAVLEREIAEQSARAERSELLATATGLWWKWVITGKKLVAYRELVAQAELRAEFLNQQAELGAIPHIEVIDNQRLLATRLASLRSLELEFTQLCLKIGLFRRDQAGAPQPASEAELPRHGTPAPAKGPPRDLEAAIGQAPGLKIYKTALEILDEQLRLQNNNRLPELNLVLHSSRSFGETRPYSEHESSVTETTAGAQLSLSWEPQQRKARGKSLALRAKRTALEQESRYLVERLSMDFRGQLAELEAQAQILSLSRRATRQAGDVREAEKSSFEAGQSSVLAVNLREQAALGAYMTELDSTLASWMAWIELHRLVGSDDLQSFTIGRGAPLDSATEADDAPDDAPSEAAGSPSFPINGDASSRDGPSPQESTEPPIAPSLDANPVPTEQP